MKNLLLTLLCAALLAACGKKPEEKAAPVEAEIKPTPQVEFGDAKYTDIGKQGIAQLSSGDVDGWMNSFADNATYVWSRGDSLSGKKAIADYWKNRRTKVIDSLTYWNDVWLSLKVNQPQKGPDMKGNWLLSWYQVKAKYKNGKKVVFAVHSDMHFDSSDKIDRFIQYIDSAPINAALAAKK